MTLPRAAAAAALASLALAATQTLAAGGPIATTGAASAVTATSAVIAGSVDPNGAQTTYQVQYGPTAAYGSATAPGSAGSGTATVPVSATVGALAPDTTYHYRLVATSANGTSNGADATFTTAKAPPTVTVLAASAVTASSAALAASVDPNGIATTVTFQYGRSTAYGSTTAPVSAGAGTAAVRAQATAANLSPDTTYHFRAVAASADGTTYGGDSAFTTARAAPGATTGAATVVHPDSAHVTGRVVTNGVATSYQFQYGPTPAYGLQTPLAVAGSGTGSVAVSATIAGLSPGTPYHYRLVAISPDGTTAGADAAFTTTGDPAVPGAQLPPVSRTTAVAITSSSVQLNGAINPPAKSTSWWFEYGPTASYGSESVPQTLSGLGARPVNARIAGLAASTTFHYRLEAQSGGALYVGPDATFTTKAIVRARPAALTLAAFATPTAHTARISASGSLETALPGACNGAVEVAIARGRDIVALRSAALHPDCTYALHLTLRRSRTGRRVTVSAHFTGNAVLLPLAARPLALAIS